MQIIPKEHIDFAKWDACVHHNANGLLYATSAYLNAMADNWSGLVINDYEAIMPLPWRKKWGIRYLYTPAFTQQLGIIGNTSIPIEEIGKTIVKFAKFGTFLFNDGNTLFVNTLEVTSCNNYIINLDKSYEEIRASYKKTFKKNINRAIHKELSYDKSINFEEAINFFYQYNKNNIQHVGQLQVTAFINLCSQLFPEKVLVRSVLNSEQELLSIVLLLTDNKRFYNIINYTSTAGRKVEANYFLYDTLFRELAGKPMLFDFEGSDLPGVKSFYESMGGINSPYPLWHFNQLPWPLRYFKK